MTSKLFKGLFGHFFTRASIIQICSGLMLLAIVLPFFDYIADSLAAEQGNTLSSSTIAATADKLYDNEYATVIDYCMDIVKNTSNIKHIIYSKKDGQEFIIRKDQWSMEEKSLPYYKLKFKVDASTDFGAKAYHIKENGSFFNASEAYEYSRPIFIGSKYWGVLTIGFSKETYLQYITQFYLTVITFTVLACLLSLYSFFASSKKVRQQIGSFEVAVKKLASGELSARAPESSIGEIGVLGQAMNSVSAALEEKSERLFQLAQIVEQTNDVFVLLDEKLVIIFANDAIQYQTGYQAESFIGQSIIEFSKQLHLDATELLKNIDWVVENQQHMPDRDAVLTNSKNRPVDISIRLELIDDEKSNSHNFLLVISNISGRKKLENELNQLAYFDKLTNLPNRRMFLDRLRSLEKIYKREKKPFALFFIDLDNFKYINDSLGHEAGDALLSKVADRLKNIFRPEDMVCRLAGDEFTVLVELKDNDSHMLINIANKLIKDMTSTPVKLKNKEINVGASVGIAQYPKDATDSDSLLRNADTAMYMAKKNGKNRFSFFSEEMVEILNKRIELEIAIKQAMQMPGELYLLYQPIIDLQNNTIIGVESLARWMHPKKGFISPLDFIAVAEKSDLIIDLSDYLLDLAFRQAYVWQSENAGIYVSVNISVKYFKTKAFVEKMETLLQKHQVNPLNILLEFTEGIMLDNSDETISKFEKLKAIGFGIAIDDFGTGYSSLGYIHQLPIDVIKIDRSFINAMINNNKSNAVIGAITKLSNALGIKTIAEGIETKEQEKYLKELACHLGQGYLYSKPVMADEIEIKLDAA